MIRTRLETWVQNFSNHEGSLLSSNDMRMKATVKLCMLCSCPILWYHPLRQLLTYFVSCIHTLFMYLTRSLVRPLLMYRTTWKTIFHSSQNSWAQWRDMPSHKGIHVYTLIYDGRALGMLALIKARAFCSIFSSATCKFWGPATKLPEGPQLPDQLLSSDQTNHFISIYEL